MNSMTFQKEGDYIVCYVNGKEVNRIKLAITGSSEEEIIDIINDHSKANPTLVGDEPNLNGLELSGDKYAVPHDQGQSYTAGNGIAITDNVISLDIAVVDEEGF